MVKAMYFGGERYAHDYTGKTVTVKDKGTSGYHEVGFGPNDGGASYGKSYVDGAVIQGYIPKSSIPNTPCYLVKQKVSSQLSTADRILIQVQPDDIISMGGVKPRPINLCIAFICYAPSLEGWC